MSKVRLFIAMYHTGVRRKYHWALIVTDGGFPTSRQSIRAFEIKQVRAARADGVVDAFWQTHKNPVVLSKSSNFFGLVAFPPFSDGKMTAKDMEAFLDEIPAYPKTQSEHKMDGTGWTCARWILDILTSYGSAWGLEFVESMHRNDTLYNEIYKQAIKLDRSEEEDDELEDKGMEAEWAYGRASDGSAVKYVSFPEQYIQ
ncbi:unnamed protein product [Peniophora sp. CBMAI 1063]|nr:unnamed protein product [Peniophora sp. CBMAI 1063]